MDNISFCSRCGGFVGPAAGQLRLGESGKVEVVCQSCEQLSQPSPQSPKADLGVSQVGVNSGSAVTGDPGGSNRGIFQGTG